MKQGFKAIVATLEARHNQYQAAYGKREAFKLGSKGLLAAFRIAARYRSPVGEIMNFVGTAGSPEVNKSSYAVRVENKLRYLRFRTVDVNRIREAVAEGLDYGADAAWDLLVHSMKTAKPSTRHLKDI